MRWGVIGAGDVVEHKSGPALVGVPGSSLTVVMRRDGERAREMAELLGAARWTTDADAVVSDPEVDAVYVATPPDTHAEHTLRAAAAGKAVYVEKPMARTESECRRMIEACEGAGVGLYVAYYRRALPRFVAAERAVRDGRLGSVRTVLVRLQRPARLAPVRTVLTRVGAADDDGGWRIRPQVSGGGLFVDLASHTLDWLDHLLGEVTAVDGDADGGPAETLVSARLRFASGVHGVGLWDFEADRALDEIEIVGTEGTLRMSCFGDDAPELWTEAGVVRLETTAPPVVQWPMVANVVESIAGRATALSTGRTAIRTARVVDGLLAEHRERHGIDAVSW